MITRKNKIGFDATAFGSEIGMSASALAESPNEGGTTAEQYSAASQSTTHPRLVIRGESFSDNLNPEGGESHELLSIGGKAFVIATPLPKLDGQPYAAITDYLNCSFPFMNGDLPSLFCDFIDCLGDQFSGIKDRNKGFNGWDNSFQLGSSSTILAYGGQNDTACISIPGSACHMVPSWQNLIYLLRDKHKGKITRWDGAVDDFEGVHSVDDAVAMYKAGMFNTGGRNPECSQGGNWIEPNGSGRTFYVGTRENGKMGRIYEKGMQLGEKWSPWVRWEVEMHSDNRVIPWEVLLEPGKYVAGAYPKATGWISKEMQRIRTVQKTAEISYDYSTRCASIAYGKLLNVMMEVEGSAEKVIEKLIRDGIPKRLDLPIVAKNEGWSK